MSAINKFDAYLIERLNALYLWLLDWTGVYVATLIFLCGAIPTVFLVETRSYIAAAIILIIITILALPRYLLQGHGMNEAYNKLALSEEGHTSLRYGFICLNLILFMLPPYTISGQAGLVSNMIIWYLLCVKIRSRDPKEFEIFKPSPQAT